MNTLNIVSNIWKTFFQKIFWNILIKFRIRQMCYLSLHPLHFHLGMFCMMCIVAQLQWRNGNPNPQWLWHVTNITSPSNPNHLSLLSYPATSVLGSSRYFTTNMQWVKCCVTHLHYKCLERDKTTIWFSLEGASSEDFRWAWVFRW